MVRTSPRVRTLDAKVAADGASRSRHATVYRAQDNAGAGDCRRIWI